MRASLVYSLLAAPVVRAFSDSSPFVLFSTSKLPPPPKSEQLQSSAQVLSATSEILSSCPTKRYLLVSQPNANAGDIREHDDCNMPNLCRAVASSDTKGQFSVAEVVGEITGRPLASIIQAACQEKGKEVDIEEAALKRLPRIESQAQRQEVLADNDYELGRLLEKLGGDYTVLLYSDRNELGDYQPSLPADSPHVDLKRSVGPIYVGRRAGDSTVSTPLFEKYQFFTPGIFMGLITVFIMLAILAVGLRALADLQVSYSAFDKDMGPAAQKKQQ